MKTKALCIVAHPDDETIWMGGTILKNKNWDWTIFSLCRSNDKDRALKFKKVCKHYNANSIITDLDDESNEPLSSSGIKEMIKNNLPEKNFDYIFTHGQNGEYGHIRHVGVHEAVTELVKEKYFPCKKLFLFAYKKNSNSEIPFPNKKAGTITKLSSEEFNKKKELITSIYGFSKDSFESLSCNELEAFTT